MEHSTSAPSERVRRITQLAKLSFNHPSVVLTADIFLYFNKISTRLVQAEFLYGAPSVKEKLSADMSVFVFLQLQYEVWCI